MSRRRTPAPQPVLYTDPGRAELESRVTELEAGLAEALGCFRPVRGTTPELDCWTGAMALAVHDRLAKIAATREGDG